MSNNILCFHLPGLTLKTFRDLCICVCLYVCVRKKSFIKVKNHIRVGEQAAERSHIPKAIITHSSYGLEQECRSRCKFFAEFRTMLSTWDMQKLFPKLRHPFYALYFDKQILVLHSFTKNQAAAGKSLLEYIKPCKYNDTVSSVNRLYYSKSQKF